MLVHHVRSHSHALDGGKIHFYEENMIRPIAFNFQVISYKPLMDLLNLRPRFSRNVAPPYFTTICKITGIARVSKRDFFLSHIARLADLYSYFQDQNKLSTLH